MPIVHMMHSEDSLTEYPEGAYCPLSYRKQYPDQTAIVVYETHHGLCIHEYERNGYHDSDFYMVVWNPVEKKTESIMFATTRGWCYPCFGSAADATPEVMEEYEKWKVYQNRLTRVREKLILRKKFMDIGRDIGRTRFEVARLYYSMRGDSFDRVVKLLKTKKFRSDFRKNLCKQVNEWLDNTAPKYSSPLSKKQLYYLS